MLQGAPTLSASAACTIDAALTPDNLKQYLPTASECWWALLAGFLMLSLERVCHAFWERLSVKRTGKRAFYKADQQLRRKV
jgi:hypothetical protein